MPKKKSHDSEIVPVGNKRDWLAGTEVKDGTKGALVAQIMQTMDIASRTDKTDIASLTAALQEYLALCMTTNTSITNTGLYAALGLEGDTINNWLTGKTRANDPRYREFAKLVKRICGQYRELAAAEGKLHPTLTIWWQKNYDNFQDDPPPEKVNEDAFLTPIDPQEIAEKYKHLLTDDSGRRMEAERAKRSVVLPDPEDEDEE